MAPPLAPLPAHDAQQPTWPRGTILLVEDTLSLAEVYRQYLREKPWQMHHADSIARAEAIMARQHIDLVLLDVRLPDGDGMDLLRRIAARPEAPPVVVITAHGSVATAVEAMQAGAADFLLKPFAAARLVVTVAHALERSQLEREVITLRAAGTRDSFHGMIGAAPAMQAVYRVIENAASSRATVFIAGESGTGKELCAQAVHALGAKESAPFVALNCAAIPRELMESEVFGHVRGAFTGATADRRGAAAAADGGTLFLDEVCEMDLALQAKLLRFVQTGTFQRVGSARTEHVTVRFLCATNRDPLEEVRQGRFREDLYYRLHVIPIHLPPLRERGDDVLAIAEHFLKRFAAEERRGFAGFAPDAQAALLAHPWPGNVRELENAIRTSVVLNDGALVTARMLPASVQARARVEPPAAVQFHPPARPASLGIRTLDDMEREAIRAAIAICDGNVPRAAAHLGVSPSTLYRKIKRWELDGLS